MYDLWSLEDLHFQLLCTLTSTRYDNGNHTAMVYTLRLMYSLRVYVRFGAVDARVSFRNTADLTTIRSHETSIVVPIRSSLWYNNIATDVFGTTVFGGIVQQYQITTSRFSISRAIKICRWNRNRKRDNIVRSAPLLSLATRHHAVPRLLFRSPFVRRFRRGRRRFNELSVRCRVLMRTTERSCFSPYSFVRALDALKRPAEQLSQSDDCGRGVDRFRAFFPDRVRLLRVPDRQQYSNVDYWQQKKSTTGFFFFLRIIIVRVR